MLDKYTRLQIVAGMKGSYAKAYSHGTGIECYYFVKVLSNANNGVFPKPLSVLEKNMPIFGLGGLTGFLIFGVHLGAICSTNRECIGYTLSTVRFKPSSILCFNNFKRNFIFFLTL
jgi:hypothetical protein